MPLWTRPLTFYQTSFFLSGKQGSMAMFISSVVSDNTSHTGCGAHKSLPDAMLLKYLPPQSTFNLPWHFPVAQRALSSHRRYQPSVDSDQSWMIPWSWLRSIGLQPKQAPFFLTGQETTGYVCFHCTPTLKQMLSWPFCHICVCISLTLLSCHKIKCLLIFSEIFSPTLSQGPYGALLNPKNNLIIKHSKCYLPGRRELVIL